MTKIYSCAAVLSAFGADHTFETPVHRRGEVVDGRLHGDLILVASGDFTLAAEWPGPTPEGVWAQLWRPSRAAPASMVSRAGN